MKLYIAGEEKLTQITLPSKIEESFLIRYNLNEVEETITLIAQEGRWKLSSTSNIQLSSNGVIQSDIFLDMFQDFELEFLDHHKKVTLFCAPVTGTNQIDFNVSDVSAITIGSSLSCSISFQGNDGGIEYIRISRTEGQALFECLIQNGCYINFRKTNQKVLESGDLIFLGHIKIIWMNSFIRIIYPVNQSLNSQLPIIQPQQISNQQYTPITEKERNVSLYDENEVFFHTPQLKFNIKKEVIHIDAPPEAVKGDEMPLFLSLGSTIMMGMTSMITGVMAILELTSGNSSFVEALPSLLICVSMFFACIFFPILINRFQTKKKKKREQLRQTKYTNYLNSKRSLIIKKLEEQSEILNNNYISLDQCVKTLSSKNNKIWNREIIDLDFLTLRLGIGDKKANIEIDAPMDHFSLDDDNLKEEVLKIANSPLLMKNVPITISLLENNVFPIILDCQNKEGYLNGIILQLMTFYSSLDLKLIFFVDEKNKEYWNYAKYLGHCISNDKTFRFFATNEEEMKQVSAYLENEYNARKKMMSNSEIDKDKQTEEVDQKNYYTNYSPYYLIITDNFKMAKDIPIIKKIIETNSNYGFSLLMIESTMKNLPSKCTLFANIVDSSSGLFGKDLSSNQSIFQAEYLENVDISSCVSQVSNIPVSSMEDTNTLPTLLEFLAMYGVGKIEQLNILNRWTTNNPTLSLSTPIGVYSSGNLFELDLHEKFHGPHGLIAGSTGSGKSEFIITYILSMAINYHPNEVQFVLIDYKGGGLAGAFENRDTKIKLPHLVGTITNLDTSEMNRTLVSIRSELKRRQKKFNEVRDSLGESTIDIYKYQRLYREGVIKEPIAHLFIISDEFAELKAQQPDFMDELISTARIGRSLGVHLILATQKPTGVVNDQIWSNSRFRICLKVQTSSDSMEMLKRPEAANIKEVGRFYLQVGYDELFELGQSAWAGTKYIPSDRVNKKLNDSIDFINNTGYIVKSINDTISKENSIELGDQLTNIVKYLYHLAGKEEIPLRQLWLPSIPDSIFVQDLIQKYQYQASRFCLKAVIGEYDDPTNQVQNLLTLDFINGGNCIIYGMSGSGKENLISTIIYSLSILHTPQEINFFILDFGAEVLKVFNNMPHVGDIATISDKDKVSNLFQMLEKEIAKRKNLFTEYGGNFYDYCTKSGQSLPMILVILNNYESFLENFDDYYDGFLNHLLREGSKYGINFVTSVSAPGSIRSRTSQYFPNIIALQLADEFDYKYYLNAPHGLTPSKLFGRGLIPIDDSVYEFQTAYITEKDQINDIIKATSLKLKEHYQMKARAIPMIPTKITPKNLIPHIDGLSKVPIGIDNDEMSVLQYDFTKNKITQISGNSLLSSPGFICGLIEEFAELSSVHLEVIDAVNCVNLNGEGVHYTSDFDQAIQSIHSTIDSSIDTKNVFLFLGIKELLNSINDFSHQQLNELLMNAKKWEDCYFIICDNYSDFKKITLEEWYREAVDTSSGIWIGDGINIQVLINIHSLSTADVNLSFDDLGYVVTNGEYRVIKGLSTDE